MYAGSYVPTLVEFIFAFPKFCPTLRLILFRSNLYRCTVYARVAHLFHFVKAAIPP